MPPGLISNYTTVTFEFWVDVGSNGAWEELYAFGNQDAGGAGANMVMFTPHSGPGDFRMSYAQADPGYDDEHIVAGVGVLDNLGPLSVACVYDPPNNRMTLYTNGAEVATLSPVTTGTKAFSLANVYNVHSWLGRSLYNGDASYAGTISEFRIYNAPLGPLQIAVDNAAGPTTVVTSIALSSLTWNVGTNTMTPATFQDTSVTFNTASYGTYTITSSTEPTYLTSDATVATVSSAGRINAVGLGNATVSAVYGGTTNSLLIHVIASGFGNLTHRYSFDVDNAAVATDSIAGANGTFVNGVYTFSGEAWFGGGTSGPLCQYIQLPSGLISGYTNVTFEFWLDAGSNGAWEELYAFGYQDTSGAGANMVMFTPHSGDNDFRMSYAQADPGYNDEYVINGVGTLDNLGEICVACVYDPPNNAMALYTNGVLVAYMSPVTTGAKVFSLTNVYDVNSWLGRSLYNGDASYAGGLDEFRIYNAALGPLQLAVDNAAGPETVVTNIAVNSIVWNVAPTMTFGSRQDTTVTFNTASYGSFTVPAATEATYATSDPTIVTVTSSGRIFATGLGSATVSASYKNQINNVVIQVSNPVLAHRYSFTSDASDSVGGPAWDGTLEGAATISGGAVQLPGGTLSADPSASYVSLPANLVTNFTGITLEAWVTDLGSPDWARIWDLGDSSGGPGTSSGGTRYMFLSLPSGNGDLLGDIYVSDRAGGSQGLEWGGQRPPVGQEAHITWVTDSAHHDGALYVNGALVAANTNMTLTPADIGPTFNDWLGRSQYDDPSFYGSIDEFRIYYGALSSQEVALSDLAGPNAIPNDVTNGPGPVVSVTPQVPTTLEWLQYAPIKVLVNYANLANYDIVANSVYPPAGLSITSSDPTIVAVTAGDLLQGIKPGTAVVTTSYQGITSKTAVTVLHAPPPTLAHRYSFTADTSDSVGGPAWAGTLQGNASVSGGQLVLPNITATAPATDYLQLPAGIITNAVNGIGTNYNFPSVTVEAWATMAPSQWTWAELFDFGTTDSSGLGAYDIHVCVHTSDDATIIGISDSDNANVHYQYFDAGTGSALDGNTEMHIVAVFNPPAGYLAIYTNGVMMGMNSQITISMAGINAVMNKIGADDWPDPGMQGSVDEFRIYNGVLDPDDVQKTQALGPNQLATFGVTLTVSVAKGNVTVSWPVNVPGATLQSKTSLSSGTWQPVTSPTPVAVGGTWQVTVPASGAAMYFRLVHSS